MTRSAQEEFGTRPSAVHTQARAGAPHGATRHDDAALSHDVHERQPAGVATEEPREAAPLERKEAAAQRWSSRGGHRGAYATALTALNECGRERGW